MKTLGQFWDVTQISDEGLIHSKTHRGFVFEAEGLDSSFISDDQAASLHRDWRSTLRLIQGEELQIIFRKRVEFAQWVEDQLSLSFLAENSYGRRILLDRLLDQVAMMSEKEPRLLSQKIIVCFWTPETLSDEELTEKRITVRSQLRSLGFNVKILDREQIEREINICAQDLSASEKQDLEWPQLKIEAGQIKINDDQFRALELTKLPESFTAFGMIQSITSLPYPLDVSVRLKARDMKPIVSRLERKRNLLQGHRAKKQSATNESQIEQIDQVLRSLADNSESIFDLQVTIGLRFPTDLSRVQRKMLGNILQMAGKLDFCEFEETTTGTFDSYLECIPSFRGKNIKSHTVLGSNAIHFLPVFRPSPGDQRPIASFQTTSGGLYGIDPVDARLANYNWLVSGTSGSGKSFFVNSLLAQSSSIDPNIFIVDIGGSYNKLVQFLGGRVMSLEPGQGFELCPFFIAKSDDPKEEQIRRHHILQIFLEMLRVDNQLPTIEVRHLLQENLSGLFEMEELPEHPITYLIQRLEKIEGSDARRLRMLLQPWKKGEFSGQFLDNRARPLTEDRILAFDLKGLTEFEDLSRVVQLIVCASLWARIRRNSLKHFSWIVLDEVAFSLLKTQPEFVDELVSTMRKYYAGAVIVVQDLEKVTSNPAGASILQNAQSKAILQQRGDPRNFAASLSLTQIDQWAIESLRREKGSFSDVFLIRDFERTVIRHVPSELEYWLNTTAPEDAQTMKSSMNVTKEDQPPQNFQQNVMDFVARRKELNR